MKVPIMNLLLFGFGFWLLLQGSVGIQTIVDIHDIDLTRPSGAMVKGLGTAFLDEANTYGHHFGVGSCKAFCNSEAYNSSDADGVECWGTFKYVCLFSGNYTQAALGTKCEGHFKYHEFENEDTEKMFAACDGVVSSYSEFTGYCPVTGATVKKVSKHSCHGSGYFLSKTCKGGNDTSCGDEEAELALEPMDHEDESLTKGFKHYKSEKKCVGTRKVERLSYVDAGNTLGSQQSIAFETLEAHVERDIEAFKESGRAMPPRPHDHHEMDGGCDKKHPCNLTCNGHKAWLHGALPCPGHFALDCSFHHHHNTSSSAAETTMEMRRTAAVISNAAAVTTAAAPSEEPWSAPPSLMLDIFSPLASVPSLEVAPGITLHAACKGLWTGALGHACFGLSKVHVEISTKKADIHVWDICSRFNKVHHHHSPKASFMATTCYKQSTSGKVVYI